VRLLPMSLTLLVFAVGVPKLAPDANPRRVVNAGFLLMFAAIAWTIRRPYRTTANPPRQRGARR